MTTTSALYWTNSLSWICIVQAHGNYSPLIDMSPNSDTLSWFRANQSLPILLNAACLAEKQHISIDNLWFYQIGIEPTIYHTRGKHANHYTTDDVRGMSVISSILNFTIILMNYQEWFDFNLNLFSLTAHGYVRINIGHYTPFKHDHWYYYHRKLNLLSLGGYFYLCTISHRMNVC